MATLIETLSSESKEFLEKNYGKLPIGAIASQLNLSGRSVMKLAKSLGLSRSRKWTREEEELLHSLAETMPLKDLIRTYRNRAKRQGLKAHRTNNAIAVYLQRNLGYSRSPLVDCYSCGQIAGALGIDRNTVGNWVRLGKLKATRRDKANGWYVITRAHLCKFFVQYRHDLVYLPIDADGWRWLLAQFE